MGGGQIRKDLDGKDIIGYGKASLNESKMKYFSLWKQTKKVIFLVSMPNTRHVQI